MSKLKYKLLASDFDNTLCRSDGTVSEYTLSKIAEFQARGGKFMICTGRMFASIRKEAKILGMCGDVISYNGGMIGDIDTGEIKYCSPIPRDIALEVVEFLEERGKIVHVYIDDTLYIKAKNFYTDYYCQCCKVEATAVGDLVKLIKEAKNTPIKILLLDSPEEIAKYSDILSKKGEGRYLVASSASNLLDIEAIDTSKGNAITEMCKYYGVDITECVCFGDSPNDISMLEVAGVGVAVANASEAVKKSADYVTSSCDDDGVAKVIDKILKGENL